MFHIRYYTDMKHIINIGSKLNRGSVRNVVFPKDSRDFVVHQMNKCWEVL